MFKKKRIYLITVLGFLSIIWLGTILLSLPICNNKPIKFIDALFVATSGVCVNGFSTVAISEQFNCFGQLVLALLVQIGALGFMSFVVFILAITNKRMSISDTLIASDAISENIYSHIKSRIINIFKYTFVIELVGMALLSLKFIPIYGIAQGIWNGIFHSITAFCNAGFNLIGGKESLISFRT